MLGISSRIYTRMFFILLISFPILLFPFYFLLPELFSRILFPSAYGGDLSNGLNGPALLCSCIFGMLSTGINAFIAAGVWKRCSSRALSFDEGMDAIAQTQMSGCGNITLLYIFPHLLFAYLRALLYVVLGLSKEKKYTEQKWKEMVKEYELFRYGPRL